MRELKRSIAKANMRKAGFEKLFKKFVWKQSTSLEGKSIFAKHWREWVIPTGKNAKLLRKRA